MSLTEVVQSIRSAWRLAMFDSSGMQGFNLTVEGFWRSYLVYLFLLPAYLILVLTPVRIEAMAMETLVLAKLISFVLRIVASTVLLALLCRLLNVGERFVGLIVAGNWGFVIQIALWLPIALLASRGILAGRVGSMVQTAALIAVLFYAWFITRAALGIGGLAALGVIVADELCSEVISTLIDRMFGVP
jgi:hypothetical protein